MELKDYLRIFRRRWPVVLLIFAATVLGVLFYPRRQVISYRSEAEIIVQEPPVIVIETGGRSRVPRLAQEQISAATQIQLIKTRDVLEFALSTNKDLARLLLRGDPDEMLPLKEEEEMERLLNLPAAKRDLTREADLRNRITAKKTALTDLMNALQRAIDVGQPGKDSSQIVKIGAVHENAELAQSIVKMVVDGFIQYSTRIPQRRIQMAIEQIEREQIAPRSREKQEIIGAIADLQQKVHPTLTEPEQAELHELQRRVEAFESDHRAAGEQRTALELRVAEGERELRRGELGPDGDSPTATALIGRLRDELQGLELDYERKSRYLTEAHPTMVQMRQEMENLRQIIEQRSSIELIKDRINRKLARAAAVERDRRALEALKDREQRLGRDLDDARRRVNARFVRLPDAKEQAENRRKLAELESRQKSVEASLQEMESQRDDLQVSLNTFTPRVQKVSEARTPWRETPPPQAPLAMAVAAGLILGFGAAYFLEYVSTSLRTEQDIRRYLNLPVLGVILQIRESDQRLLINVAPKSPLSEVFNTISTLLESYGAEYGARIFMVASSKAGEGKSTITSNLAVAMARSGRRVILVDADLRKSVLHRFFNVDNAQGLSTYVDAQIHPETAADAPALESIVRPTETENLRVLPAGPHPANPVGLIKSPAFKAMLGRLRDMADVVFIDVPPTNLAVDTMVMASMADAVLLLVSAGETNKDEVTYAKRIIEAARGKLLGCILNKASSESHGYYYYYYYYYDSYKYYRQS